MGEVHFKIMGWSQLVAIGKAPGVRYYFGNALTQRLYLKLFRIEICNGQNTTTCMHEIR
jgi:hypothetical protein